LLFKTTLYESLCWCISSYDKISIDKYCEAAYHLYHIVTAGLILDAATA